jgi:hypothetical protein
MLMSRRYLLAAICGLVLGVAPTLLSGLLFSGLRWHLGWNNVILGAIAATSALMSAPLSGGADTDSGTAWGLVLLIVAGLYLAACFTPAVGIGEDTCPGWGALLIGWASPVPWSGNILLLIGIWRLARGNCRSASVLGWVAAGLGLIVSALGLHCRIGYYLWEASFVALAVGAHVVRDRPETRELHEDILPQKDAA